MPWAPAEPLPGERDVGLAAGRIVGWERAHHDRRGRAGELDDPLVVGGGVDELAHLQMIGRLKHQQNVLRFGIIGHPLQGIHGDGRAVGHILRGDLVVDRHGDGHDQPHPPPPVLEDRMHVRRDLLEGHACPSSCSGMAGRTISTFSLRMVTVPAGAPRGLVT